MEQIINLDKGEKLDNIDYLKGNVTIIKNKKVMVRKSVLENMDIYSKEELKFIFTELKQYIAPIVTSVYIPSREQMEILNQYAPEFKVRFKVETPGAEKIMPITYEEYIKRRKNFSRYN